jgi:hypothetical protein|tara:strand:+ start:67 stop:201 length:135 start_codon:yes stop_codon:yes gene_type:complete
MSTLDTIELLIKIAILSFSLVYGMWYVGSAIDFVLIKYLGGRNK